MPLLEHDILMKLSPRGLGKYLISHPSHIEHVRNLNTILCGSDWLEIVKANPIGMDRYCDWSAFNHWEITKLLCFDYSKYKDNFDLSILEGYNWYQLFSTYSKNIVILKELEKECDVDKFDAHEWVKFLCKNEVSNDFLDKCNYSLFYKEDWEDLLLLSEVEVHQNFIDRVPWDMFDGDSWVRILRSYPQYMEFYDKMVSRDVINVDNWIELFKCDPKFEDSCDILDQFTPHHIANMINRNIRCRLVDNFDWNLFTQNEWDILS